MSGGFTAPAVMDALVTAFGAVTLDGEVRDGGEPRDDSALEVIAVGFTGPDDDAAAEAQVASGGQGPRERETYDVRCAAAVATGDRGIPAARRRVFAILNDCRAQLVADPTLRGACMQARVSSWALTEDATTGGPVVRIRFEVHVEAFTTS
jgi:hypothetical protein